MAEPRLVIFTRYPEAGKAKTRLIPALGEQGAADLHRLLAEQTVETARSSGLTIEVYFTAGDEVAFANWLGNDLTYAAQCEGELGERLLNAAPPYPTMFIGTDCPDLTAEHLHDAAAKLASHRAVIGPAEDGGYWLLGLNEPCDVVFSNITWGTETVFEETLVHLRSQNIEPAILETLSDCDRPEDLKRWPELTA